MKGREEVRDALTGPVPSIRTPFNRDGSIDYDSLRGMIDFDIAAGARTIMLTAGDSLYQLLRDEEIAEVTKAVADHAAGRAMVIAADWCFATAQAVEFARYARSVGADLLMVRPPDWSRSCTTESLADHYAAVAEQIPVMLVTNLFIARGPEFGLETIKQVLRRTDNVVAVKDDVCGAFAQKMALLVHDRWAMISGGRKQNHLNQHPYGCDGYLSTFITFKPEVARRYWDAIARQDIPAAVAVVRDYDIPYFDFVASVRGGYDAALHGTMEIFGVAKRWRRPPFHSLSDEEMETLAGSFRGLSLL